MEDSDEVVVVVEGRWVEEADVEVKKVEEEEKKKRRIRREASKPIGDDRCASNQ